MRAGLTSAGAAMGRRSASGLTLAEVALALVVLSIGVLALIGTSAMVTRMLGAGRAVTLAAQVGAARLEWLRRLAGSTLPPCTHPRLAAGSALTRGISERWSVESEGSARLVALALEYPAPRGPVHDTLLSILPCRAD